MTKEEAIKALEYELSCVDVESPRGELAEPALIMAIESLSTETHEIRTETHGVCSDLISKEEAIAIAYRQCDGFITIEQGRLLEGFEEEIRALPSADTQTSGDLISREDAIAICHNGKVACVHDVADELKKLPSADRPSGEWVESLERNDMMHWSSYSGYCTNCGDHSEYLTRYCGECGAVMYALNGRDEVIGGAKMGGNK